MSRNLPHPDQNDFFQAPALFASRPPDARIDIGRFRSRLKRGMAQAIRESGRDRPSIAADMAQLLGAACSRAMLDAYTSEAKTGHDISVVRFKAFARATGAASGLWDLVVSDEGLTVLCGDEPRLAEIARLQQEERAIRDQLRRLRAVPVNIRPRG